MNPYIEAGEGGLKVTPEGLKHLQEIVTDPTGQVYAFTDKAPRLAVAAAMARLSRSANDMRVIYLNEFAGQEDRTDDLIDRVVTQFGDDSVQQLMPMMMVTERISNLATKKVERGRFAAYLEQSTRYIFFDNRINGHYPYYTPTNLRESVEVAYRKRMDEIFDLYSSVVRQLTEFVRSKTEEPSDSVERTAWLNATRAQACDGARTMLPVATQSTVAIVGSAQAIDNMIMFLASEELQECTVLASSILKESRKVAEKFFSRTDKPDRGGATIAHRKITRRSMEEVAEQHGLRSRYDPYDPFGSRAQLILATPLNELDVVHRLLFATSNRSLDDIHNVTGELTTSAKAQILQKYIGERLNRRHKPGRALEKIHYEWEIVGDYGTFRDLQRHRVVDGMEWQDLTPYLGYAVPALIAEAGLTDKFEHCFDLSRRLYELLRNDDLSQEAQYAVLLGHNIRYTFMINARASFHLHELRTAPTGHPGYRKLVKSMHDQVASVHPIIGAGMKFVNMGEDPALTRLAAELATQSRLALLEGK